MTEPARARAGRTYLVWAGLFVIGVAVGAGAVGWFTAHYRIVPVEGVQAPQVGLAAPGISPQGITQEQAAETTSPAAPANTTAEAVSAPQAGRSAYTFAFTPEELLYYRLDTTISGEGVDSGLASDIYMDFDSDFSLYTKSVDNEGNADLRLLFENASLSGSFMGSPFEMGYTPDRTFVYDGRTTIDTSQGGSVQGIPQLEFFKQPVSIRVAPNGQVLSVEGQAGLAGMLQTIPTLARVEFPEEGVPQSGQWESRIKMPIPGFGQAVDTRIVNTLVGYEYVGNRYCGVIHQSFGAAQADGTVDSPESAFGPAIQFSVPLFDLQGTNTVYFDVQNGQLVQTLIDLKLVMNLGSVLGDAAGLLGGLGQSLLGGNMEGLEGIMEPSPSQPDLLNMSVAIQGAITQIDQVQTQAPTAQ